MKHTVRPGLQCFSSSLPRWRSCRSNSVQSLESQRLPFSFPGREVEEICCCSLSSIMPALVRWPQTRGGYRELPTMEQFERQKKCFCSVQVCSVLRSLFLRIGVVYGISNFTNGVGHAEVMYLVILVLMSIFLNFSSRWRMQHLDAETRRQFELYCDLVSEHHTSPCWWCLI